MMIKRSLLYLILFFAIQSVFAQIPDGYYDNATGSGYTLKTQLYNIIKNGHIDNGYGALYNAYELGDTDPEDGYVWDMYSENPNGTDPYNFVHYENQCGNYQNEGDCYNREHLFPQGIFDEAYPMKSDYHHVIPSDGKVNGMRSNYPFGEVNNASWVSLNGSKKGTCNHPDYSGTVFEPIDEYKGDIARSMLYFGTRYEDRVGSWTHDMINGTSDQVFTDWFIEVLLKWHNEDPVSSKEITRNDVGYNYQGNRNPFIDHPEFVAQIWGEGENVPPSISNMELTPANPTSADAVSVSATINDSDGSITNAEMHWGLSSGNLSNAINMTHSSGDIYISDTDIPAQADGTSVYFEIEATDDSAATTTTQEYIYTVNNSETGETLVDENFDSCPPGDWTIYSAAGSKDWICDNENGYMSINAYESDEPCDDWLISPALDLDGYANEILTFISWTKYNDTYYPAIALKYSVDYDGTGDPSASTWNNLSATWAPENSETWTESGEIDLSDISGNQVYLAFHYTSSGTGAGSSSWWEVDHIIVTGDSVAETNNNPEISNVTISPENPESNDNVNVSATITDSDGTISAAKIKWGTSTGEYSNEETMNPETGDTYLGVIPAQPDQTTVYYVIEAEDNEGGVTVSDENNYQVFDAENQAPVISNVVLNPENPTSDDNVNISASVIDSDGDVESVVLKWKKDAEAYNEQNMNLSGGKYHGQISKQPAGTTIDFSIVATDDLEAESIYENTYEVSEANAINELNVSDLQLFPNPASEELNVFIPTFTGKINFKIYNALGILVMEEAQDILNEQCKLKLNGIKSGIYFIKISTESATTTKRLMINP